MKKIKYIVIAGSSGGHILPALAYINNLSFIKDPNNILFITNEIGKKYSLHEVDGQVKTSNDSSDFEPINIFMKVSSENFEFYEILEILVIFYLKALLE